MIIHPKSFDQWLKDSGAVIPVCGVCNGSGYHSCECGHRHKCDKCKGDGKDIAPLRLEYEFRVKREAEVLALMNV